MAYFNYKVSSREGKFYQSSKEPKEGYVEVVYNNGNSKIYHNYLRTLQGVPVAFRQESFNYEGKTLKTLKVSLKDGEDFHNISCMLWTPKGQYTNEVKALISAFNNYVKLGEEVTLTASTNKYTDKKGVERSSLSLYLNYVNILNEEGKGLSTGFIRFDELPKAELKEVAGEKVYDFTKQTEFYFQKLEEISKRLENAVAPKKETVKQEEPKEDLPF